MADKLDEVVTLQRHLRVHIVKHLVMLHDQEQGQDSGKGTQNLIWWLIVYK